MRAKKKKDTLHFYIWISQENHHYSLVMNIDDYYVFLDSCSIFFKRWPNQEIISQNDNDNLFNKFKTFVMLSFLQNDHFNCVSFVFAFIEILIQLYENNGKKNLINYLLEYFNILYDGLFITESTCSDLNSIEPKIYFLPKEILQLSQSTSKLKQLLELAKQYRTEEIKTINMLINDNKVEKKITLYRKFHLDFLMESIV